MASKEHINASELPGDKGKNAASENRSAGEINDTSSKRDRMGDLGNSGQFAPGGYYNQQGAAKPDRVDLDEEQAPRRQLGNRQ